MVRTTHCVQLIVMPQTQMHFTEAGDERIDHIRAELQSLVDSATFGPTSRRSIRTTPR